MHQLPPSCLHLIAQHISSLPDLLSLLSSCRAFRQLSCQDLLASYLLQHVTCTIPLQQLQQLLARLQCTTHLAVHCMLSVLPCLGVATSHWCLLSAWASKWAIHAGEQQLLRELLLVSPLPQETNEAAPSSDGLSRRDDLQPFSKEPSTASNRSAKQYSLSSEEYRMLEETQKQQAALLLLVLTDCTSTPAPHSRLGPAATSSCRAYARLVLGALQEVIRKSPGYRPQMQAPHSPISCFCMHSPVLPLESSHSPMNSMGLLRDLLELSCVGRKGDVHPMSWALKRLRNVPAHQLSSLARDALAAKARIHHQPPAQPCQQACPQPSHSHTGAWFEAAMLPGSQARHSVYTDVDVWAAPSIEDEAEAEFETVLVRLQQVVGVVANPWREVRWQQAGSNRLTALSPHPYWAWGLHDACPSTVIPEQDARFLDAPGEGVQSTAGAHAANLWPAPSPPIRLLHHLPMTAPCSTTCEMPRSERQQDSTGHNRYWDIGLLLQPNNKRDCCSGTSRWKVGYVSAQQGLWVQTCSPAYLAAYYGRWWLLKMLLEDSTSQLGTAMEGAAAGGQTWVLRALTHPDGPYTACVYTWTHQAMTKAAKHNQARTLSWLLHRSEVEVPAEMLAVLCLHAAKSGSLKVVRQLVKTHGVNPNARHPQATMLQLAACEGHAHVIRALSEELGAPDLGSPQGVCKALLLATQAGHAAAVQAIVALAAKDCLPALAIVLHTALNAQHTACALLILSSLAQAMWWFSVADAEQPDEHRARLILQALQCLRHLSGLAGLTQVAYSRNAAPPTAGMQLFKLLQSCSAYLAARQSTLLWAAILTTSMHTGSDASDTWTSEVAIAQAQQVQQQQQQLTSQLCQAAGLAACLDVSRYIQAVQAPLQWMLGVQIQDVPALLCMKNHTKMQGSRGMAQAAGSQPHMGTVAVASKAPTASNLDIEDSPFKREMASPLSAGMQSEIQPKSGVRVKSEIQLASDAGAEGDLEPTSGAGIESEIQPAAVVPSHQSPAEIEVDEGDGGVAACARLQHLLMQLLVQPEVHPVATTSASSSACVTHGTADADVAGSGSGAGSTVVLPGNSSTQQGEPSQDVSQWVRYSSWPAHSSLKHVQPTPKTQQQLLWHSATQEYKLQWRAEWSMMDVQEGTRAYIQDVVHSCTVTGPPGLW